MTRTELCQLLGVSPKSLYLWERAGKIPRPKRDRRGWRSYSAADVAVVRRRLGIVEERRPSGSARLSHPRMLEGLSARNQLRGTVVSIRGSSVLCEVVVRLGDGQEITSVITRRSADRLGVKRGIQVTAVIKSTEVMLFC